MKKIKLKDIATIFSGINYPPKGKDFGEGKEYRIINIANIAKDGIIEGNINTIKTNKERSILKYVVNTGTVIVNSRGTIIKSAIITDEHAGALISSNIIGIEITDERFIPEYLFAFFISEYGQMEVRKRSKSAISLIHLNLSSISDIVLPIPSNGQLRGIIQMAIMYKNIKSGIREQNKIVQEVIDSTIMNIVDSKK